MKYKFVSAELFSSLEKHLYRIQALKSFGDVKEGDLGGYVESESNLSQEGDCWIYDEAKVFGGARVFEDARIYDAVIISGCSEVSGNSWIIGNSIVVDSKIPRNYNYRDYLIIPKDHPDFWDYRLEHPELAESCLP